MDKQHNKMTQASAQTKYSHFLERRLLRKKRVNEIKAELYKNSHSLFWVWEFSKKAILICFIFYIIVQIYAMVVMIWSGDFSYLGDLINKTGDIVENGIFAYLIKSGIENIPKIWLGSKKNTADETDEIAG